MGHLLDQLRADGNGLVAFFERELEHRKAKSYDVLKAPLKGMELIPVSSEAGTGAETITYEQYENTGIAKVIANYAADMPRADVKGKEFTARIRSIGDAFGYSLQEIRAAMFAGKPLEQRKANAAVRAMQEKWDHVIFYGDATYGLQGWLTNVNIPSAAVKNDGDASGTTFTSKLSDPSKIVRDLNKLVHDVLDTTNEVEKPNTIVLPVAQRSLLATTRMDSGTDTTILKFFLENNGYVDQVIGSNRLKAASLAAAGVTRFSGDIMIAYDRNPDKVTFEMPQPFEQLPVQERNMEFVVNCHSRVGGVLIYYPLSMNIGEGI